MIIKTNIKAMEAFGESERHDPTNALAYVRSQNICGHIEQHGRFLMAWSRMLSQGFKGMLEAEPTKLDLLPVISLANIMDRLTMSMHTSYSANTAHFRANPLVN